MSNNKQSSLDYYITKLTEILGTEIIKQISMDDNERIARLEKQAKEMCITEHEKTWNNAINAVEKDKWDSFEHYYNETFNNDGDSNN